MNRYIGVNKTNAKAMTREEYNELRGWTVPADENPDDEGYLVEYVDGGEPNHPDFSGYISWSPKDVFERAYRPAIGMVFGLAVEAMKRGAKVARTGWNGKGMWLCLGEGRKVYPDVLWNKHTSKFAHEKARNTASGGDVTTQVLPCIIMKTATDEILMGWLASQTDILAEDWLIVE